MPGGPPAFMPAFDPFASQPVFRAPQPTWQPPRQQPPVRQPAPAPTRASTQTPRPIIRAQAPDEPARPRTTALSMPSPEELGVVRTASATAANNGSGADWATVRARLQALGADCYQMQKLADGRRSFLIIVPSSAGRSHRIEARADNETEAIRLALDRADLVRNEALAAAR